MPTDPAWTHLLLFDGVCNLCDNSVQWVLAHDHRGIVHFCSIQSELGSKLYRERGFDPAEPHSMVLITPEGSFAKSDAALQLAALMGVPFLAHPLQDHPPPPARPRLHLRREEPLPLLWKKDACLLPRPKWKRAS